MSPRAQRSSVVAGLIFATILIDFIGFSILIPVLPRYAEELGASPERVGLILSLYAVGLVLFLPVWGWISDRIGRRPVLLACLVGTAVSFVMLAFSETVTQIYIARALGGFFGASIGTAQAYMTDITDADERAQGMGLIGAAFGIGFVLGNFLGGVLQPLHPAAPFWATAGLALVNFLLAAFLLPESRPAGRVQVSWRRLGRTLIPAPLLVLGSVHDLRTRVYLYLFFHIFACFSALEAMVPLYTARLGWSVTKTAFFLAYIGVVIGVTQGLLIGRLARFFGETPLVISGLALTGASMIGFAVFRSLGPLLVVGAALAFGNGIAFPTFTSLFSKVCAEGEAGESLGQSQAMAQTGRALGPYWGGWALAGLGIGAPFLLGGLGLLGAAGLFILALRLLVPPEHAA